MATIIVGPAVGPEPANLVCPSCQAQVITTTELRASTRTHMYAAVLCLLGCFLCACLPYCCTSCRDTIHTCPNCKAHVGVYKR